MTLLVGDGRKAAQSHITESHYSHCVPAGKSYYFLVGDAFYVFSIPANRNIGPFLLGNQSPVWELSRMWAPNDHHTVLTAGLAQAIAEFRAEEPGVVALVSYADPKQGHEGGVYRAASWLYTGQSSESRYYVDGAGQSVSRRKFHSGSRGMTKAEIESLGYTQLKVPGKHRFAKGLTKVSRSILASRWAPAHPQKGMVHFHHERDLGRIRGSADARSPSGDSAKAG